MGRDIALAIRYLITHVLLPLVVIAECIYIIGITFGSCRRVDPAAPDTVMTATHTGSSHYERIQRLERVHIPSIPLFVYRIDSVHVTADTTLYRAQKVYSDSTYTAFVSGIDPQLDSIRTYTQVIEKIDTVYQRLEYTVTVPVEKKRKNIGIGVTVGPVITTHGFDFGAATGITIYF